MTFVCPNGRMMLDGKEVTGQLFLMCLPDDFAAHAAQPYESTPLMSHFMNDANLPPIARIAEFLRLLEAKTAEQENEIQREKETERVEEMTEIATRIGEAATRPSTNAWETEISRDETPVVGMTIPYCVRNPINLPPAPHSPIGGMSAGTRANTPWPRTSPMSLASLVHDPRMTIGAQVSAIIQDAVASANAQPISDEGAHLQYPSSPPMIDAPSLSSYRESTPPALDAPTDQEDQLADDPVVPLNFTETAPGVFARYDFRPRNMPEMPEMPQGAEEAQSLKRKANQDLNDRTKKRKENATNAILEQITVPVEWKRLFRVFDLPMQKWNNKDISTARSIWASLTKAVNAQKKALQM